MNDRAATISELLGSSTCNTELPAGYKGTSPVFILELRQLFSEDGRRDLARFLNVKHEPHKRQIKLIHSEAFLLILELSL